MSNTPFYTKTETDYKVQDAKSQAYLGIATTTTVPPATGAYWYKVNTAGTYTNFLSGGSPIIVTEADLDVVNGVANNRVILEVNNGVAKKIVERVKGDKGDAKLPLYSAIKSANIAAGTQFIDDENGNIQYRVKSGQTLLTTELPANVLGTKVEYIAGYSDTKSVLNSGEKSGNLIDPSKFKGVVYSVNSGTQKIQEAANLNALSVHISGVEENTQYFLQGLGVVTNAASAMVIFSDATNTLISTILKQDFTGSFVSPAGTKNIYVTISREANSGVNVSQSPYVNTAQLKKGNAATDFKEFGKFYFNAEYIKGLPEVIADNETIKKIEPILVKSGNLIDPSRFRGATFTVNATTQNITESANVNWLSIHIEGGLIGGNTYYLQGLGTITNGSVPLIIFADATYTHISTILKQDFTGSFIAPLSTAHTYIRIANAMDVGVNPTESVYKDSAQLKEGDEETEFEPFGKYFIDGNSIKKTEAITHENFVQLFPYTTAYNGTLITHTVAMYYEKLSNGMYIGHRLYYNKFAYEDVTETGFFEGGEVVRYAGANLYTYNAESNVMTGAGQEFITTAESEFVMSSGGWIGGYHGHENLTKVYFLVDGIPYNANGNMDFPASGLIPCKQFSYVQKSIFKHYSNLSDLCERNKLTEFKNGGYVTQTRFKALQSFSAMAYAGIVCMGKIFNKVTTDNGDIFTPTGTTNFLIDEKMTRSVIYAGSNYSGRITNEIKGDLDAQGYVLLWDRASDTKYYRQLKTVDFVVGDIFESKTTVTITANE